MSGRRGARVCWVSDHQPLQKQLELMKFFAGDYELVQVTTEYSEGHNVNDIIRNSGCDMAVVSVVRGMEPDISAVYLRFYARFRELHDGCRGGDKCKLFDERRDIVIDGKHLVFVTFRQKP